MIDQLLARFAGYAIGTGIVALTLAFRLRPWVSGPISSPVTQTSRSRRTWNAGSPATCASAWPRWRASGKGRVAHLGNPLSLRQAFTPGEQAALMIGVLGGLALGAWGLWRLNAPASSVVVCTAVYVGAIGAWWQAANSMMNGPSSASDVLELGWHDMLRFQRVRAQTATAAWVPAFVLLQLDSALSSYLSNWTSIQLWPVEFAAVLAVVLYLIFRQGRHLWRRAWETRQPGMRPPR